MDLRDLTYFDTIAELGHPDPPVVRR